VADEIGKLFQERKIKAAIQKLGSSGADKAIEQLGEIGTDATSFLTAALKNKNYKVRRNAALALGRVKDKMAIAPLLRIAQEDENPEVQEGAVIGLASMGYPVMKSMIQMLEEEDLEEERRKTIVKVLDNMELTILTKSQQAIYQLAKGNFAECAKLGSDAVPCLMKSLTRGDEKLKEKAETTLMRIGIGAISALTDALFSNNDALRTISMQILEKMDIKLFHNTEKAAFYLARGNIDKCIEFETSALSPLLKALEDIRPEIVEKGIKGLKKLGPKASDALIKELKGRKRKTKGIIAKLLGELKDRKAVDVLISCLSDMETDVRINAAQSLCEIGDEKAIPFLINKALLDKDKRVRVFTGDRLKKMGKVIAPSLIKILEDEKSSHELRETSVRVLGEIKAGEAIHILTGIMLDGKGKIRELAASSLGEIGDKKAVPSLIKVLDEAKELSGWQRGFNATVSLGKIGDTRAVEPLIKIFHDDTYLPQLQGAAAEALGRIGEKKVIDDIIKELDNKKIQREVINAIGVLKNTKGIEPLIKLLQAEDSSSPLKGLIIDALGNIGDYSASEHIMEALKQEKLKRKAVIALGKIREEKAIPQIEEILFDKQSDKKLRKACVNNLINIKKRSSITSMLKVLKNRDVDLELKKLIVDSFPEMGEIIIKPCIKELKEEEENIELDKYLIGILGKLKSPKAVPGLLELMKITKEDTIKSKIAMALGNIGDESSLKTLIEEFENAENSNFIRKASLISLISMEDRTSLPLIIKTFESGNKELRDFTVKIFEQLDIPIYEKEKEKDKEEAK